MTTAPLSVVIPTFRDGKALARALTSIANQTSMPAEIIVVDDAGNDETCASILPLFDGLPITLLTLEQNVGPGVARNLGIAASREAYVGFLDADDEWHPEKVERQMVLMLGPGAPAITAHVKSFSGESWPRISTIHISSFSRFGILLRNPASISTVIVRRDAIQHMFPDWYAGEDYAFVAANLLTETSSLKINAVLARAHKPAFGASGLSAQMLDMQLGEMRAHRLLRHKGLIGFGYAFILVPWTFLKFARRLALNFFRWRRRA